MSDDTGKKKILIVDDEEGIRSQIYWALSDHYEVFQAADAQTALEIVKAEKPDLAAIDIALSSVGEDTHGIDLLVEALEAHPEMKVIMVTGNEEKETALRAIDAGAHDYFQKPIDLEELKVIIRRALYVRQLEADNRDLQAKLAAKRVFHEIIGSSPKMVDVFKKIETIANSEYTVLITGESGTGKELVAKAIHAQSQRCDNPFITINCGAIPEMLLESELFGHEKGAFTSAIKQRKGKFELADGGTIFLDEIGDMSMSAQAKVLRVLQESEITRVGGDKNIKVNARVFAATNKNLRERIDNNEFREDLYHRLSVILIHVPSLNERTDDIPMLTEHFISQVCTDQGFPEKKFTEKAMGELKKINWTGNIRELRNAVERLLILSEEEITDKDVKTFVSSAR